MFLSIGLENQARTLFYLVWFTHMALILAFGIYILYSKHLHILASHFNLFFHSTAPKGALQPIMDMEEADSFGASNVAEFTWKQLLDLYACTECGHCNVNCPATLSEKPLHPKDIITNLKKHLLADGKDFLKGVGDENKDDYCVIGSSIVPEDNIWDCTNCGACMEACPVGIEHVQKIVDMRRYLVLMESKFPSEAKSVFKGMENNSNPWGIGKSTREEWAKGLDMNILSNSGGGVDILFYVGCAGSFDDHGKKVARAMVKILNVAGINFGILGNEEVCCGDPARRIGNEYLYQLMVEENINVLNKYRFRRIVTACPHGFNTLKNEYPKLGGKYEVLHHTELITELIKNGKLRIKGELDKIVTYHDSCFLGRYNSNYELPRKIINAIPKTKLVEMDRNRKFAFCCGAGGGRMWLPRVRGQRVYAMRTEQALAKNPDLIATACPFCAIHFEDGLKFHDADGKVRVLDVAEFVADHLDL
jgi:Fe-S oxidoreductase